MGPCWHYFSLLGASWAHFAVLPAFAVALGRFLRVLDRAGLDFGGIRDGSGRVLEVPGPNFWKFFGVYGLAM